MNYMFNVTCWYIALALCLIILFPLLYHLLEKDLILFCGLSILLSFLPFKAIILTDRIWLLPFALGMIAAKYNLFDYFIKKTKTIIPSIGIAVLFAAMLLVRRKLPFKTDAFFAFAIVCFVTILAIKLPVFGVVFEFIGKHSANIFMIHTFFFSYYFKEFFYSPKYPALIFLLLLAVCLLYSVILEKIKSLLKTFFSKKQKVRSSI